MQLFTFGHPCEHQLRRVCIGGTSCPLNGYPDHWCCSFVKGRINFKRDKPCEGNRCRWGFAHPPTSSFDAVTLVLQEGRACAAKMEEGYGSGAIHGGPYTITSPHAADVAHCALNMLRVPPMRVAPRVGGLLAFAAVRAGDAKVFTQLLKTVKKPVDDYLIGAHEYIVATTKEGKGKLSKADAAVLDDLRNDVLGIMAPALSHQGELIVRTEQLPLQTYYLAALKSATRNKKKNAEALEVATATFPAAAARAGQLVAPASWSKASASSEADSSDAAGDSTTTNPSVPEATKTPLKQQQSAPAPAVSPAAKSAPVEKAVKAPVGAKLASAGFEEKDKKPAAPAPTAAPAAKAPASPKVAPSLLSACDSLGCDPAFSFNEFPGIASVAFPQPEPSLSVFGGLFSLDINAARSGPVLEVATTERRDAPLGSATRESDTIAAWRTNAEQLVASEPDLERRAELQAAASALAAADVVLEAMSASR
jgi:hypothetical protein